VTIHAPHFVSVFYVFDESIVSPASNIPHAGLFADMRRAPAGRWRIHGGPAISWDSASEAARV
jgi:hypothetical protein